VAGQARKLGLAAEVEHLANPRIEQEQHYYNPVHTKLLDLGLEPHFLCDELVHSMLEVILKYKDRIKTDIVLPKVKWNGTDQEMEALKLMWAGA
jgi:UDP-sulfoquinovose synthase